MKHPLFRTLSLLLVLTLAAAGVSAQADTQSTTVDEYGFTLTYPAAWPELQLAQDFNYYFTGNEDGSTAYIVTVAPNANPVDLGSALRTQLSYVTFDGGFAAATIDGVPGVEAAYTWDDNGITVSGRAFVIYHAATSTALIFSAEVTQNNANDLPALYSGLVAGVDLADAPDAPALAADAVSGSYIQAASGGSLAQASGSTYTLQLDGVNEFTPWLITVPEFNAGTYNTFELAFYWSQAEGTLTTTGTLITDSFRLFLTLSNPEYDVVEGTMRYTAVVGDVEPLNEDVTGEFDFTAPIPAGSQLVILADQPFEDAMLASFAANQNEVRGKPNCPSRTRRPRC